MNKTSIEGLLVVRNDNKEIIAVISKTEGEQKYEIYSTTTASIDEIKALLENKPETKV